MKPVIIIAIAVVFGMGIILGIMFISMEKTLDGFEDIQNWQTFDYSKYSIGHYLEGYTGTIVEKNFVYFVSHDSSIGKHGEVLRYDTTQEFDSVESWSTFDASKNGVGNNPKGYSGIISDGQFLYFVPYHNGENFHGEVLRYDTHQEFDSVESWSTFDASKNGIGYDATGYWGGTFDGRFVYFSPDWNSEPPLLAEAHGEVLRYDTTQEFDSVESWSTFDASKNGVGNNPREYLNAIFDGQFLYFAPLSNEEGFHGEVLRYDTTQEFDSVESWSAFDASKNGIGYDATGYDGIIFDGRFVYFSPRSNDDGPHGEVLRYDTTQEFDSVESWSTFDASKNGVGNNPKGFGDGVFDGQFVYFAPLNNGENFHGEVLRYDTTQEFDSVKSWSTFDASKNGVGLAIGFQDVSFDGQFLYFSPLNSDWGFSHEILRYDTTQEFNSVESWSTFNPVHDAPYSPIGYSNGIYEKNYVYFAQINNGRAIGGETLRYDTTQEFNSVESWSTFDAGNFGIGVDPDGYSGIVSDGQFLYFAPMNNGKIYHGEVLRYDTTQEFDSVESWSTFDASKNGVGDNPKGFSGGVFDGQFVYFVPLANEENGPHGEVLRYDTTQEFDSVKSWSAFDVSKNGIGYDATGYWGGVFDGQFVYFAPFSNTESETHGEVLRYDTTQEFDSVESWSTFDASKNGVGNNPKGFGDGVFDGQFLYFVPLANEENGPHGEVLRYDTTQEFDSVESWSAFDASKNGIGYDATGYWGGTFDGRFVYFSPRLNNNGPHGEVLRYDTTQEFDSVKSWSAFDASKNGVGYDATGYWGAVFGGDAIYFVPSFQNAVPHGNVLKYNIMK